MTDVEIVVAARESELRGLFAALFRGVAALDPNAPRNFAEGLRMLRKAEEIALGAVKDAHE